MHRSSLSLCCSPCSRAKMQTLSTACSARALHTPSLLSLSSAPGCLEAQSRAACGACRALVPLPCANRQACLPAQLRDLSELHLGRTCLSTCCDVFTARCACRAFFPSFRDNALKLCDCLTAFGPDHAVELQAPPVAQLVCATRLLQTVTEACSAGRVHECHPADAGCEGCSSGHTRSPHC